MNTAEKGSGKERVPQDESLGIPRYKVWQKQGQLRTLKGMSTEVGGKPE